MIRAFLLVLFLAVSAPTMAAYTSVSSPAFSSPTPLTGLLSKPATWLGVEGAVMEGQIAGVGRVAVAGTTVAVAESATIASGAGAVVVGALRLVPGIAGAATVAWLAQKGIEYAQGEFKKKAPDPGLVTNGDVPINCSTVSMGHSVVQSNGDMFIGVKSAPHCGVSWPSSGTFYSGYCSMPADASGCGYYVVWMQPISCPSGYTKVGNTCTPDASYVPVPESDWAQVRGETPPDAVLNELCKQIAATGTTSAGCPVNNPVLSPAKAALTDWVQDPKTGEWSRQVAQVTPAPTSSDWSRAQVGINTETLPGSTAVDPATGKPVNSPSTTAATDTKPNTDSDLCTLHPDILACAQMGTPPDPADISKLDKTVTIAPQDGWGPSTGTCPADHVEALRNGMEFRVSYFGACQIATSFRPVVIGFAWVAAVLIAIGITKRYG